MNEEIQDQMPATAKGFQSALEHELQAMRDDWWWLLLLGISLLILGTVAIACAPFVSFLTVAIFGVVLLISGVAVIISAFRTGKWSAFLMNLLVGILYLVVGILIIDRPGVSLVALTLLMACFFVATGIFRMAAALAIQFPQWGWALLSGFITLMLGILIFKGWKMDDDVLFVVIGVFVGVELLFHGWMWIMLSLAVRRLPAVEQETSE